MEDEEYVDVNQHRIIHSITLANALAAFALYIKIACINLALMDSLLEWLAHSKKKYCELCEHPFTFTPIYREDMPERVPLNVLLKQCIRRAGFLLKITLRAILVIMIWLVMLPYFTLWTWRFYFWSGENIGFPQAKDQTLMQQSSSSSSLVSDDQVSSALNDTSPHSSISFTGVNIRGTLADCLEGQIITAFVILLFVAAYLFREWVTQNMPPDDQAQQPPQPPQPQEVEVPNGMPRRVPPTHHQLDELPDDQRFAQQQVAVATLLQAMQNVNVPNDEIELERTQLTARLEDVRRELQRRRLAALQSVHHHEDAATVDNEMVAQEGNETETEGSTAGSGPIDYQSHHSSTYASSASYEPSSIPWEDRVEELWSPNTDRFHDKPSDVDSLFESTSTSRSSASPNLADIDVHIPNQHTEHTEHPQRPILRSDWSSHNAAAVTDDAAQATNIRWRAPEFEAPMDEQIDQHAEPNFHLNRFDGAGRGANPIPPVEFEPFGGNDDDNNNNNNNNGEPAEDEEEPFDLADDLDGVLEAIGMRGNPWMLVQNSVLMSLVISLCLGVAVWIPYVIGRLVILIRPISFIQTPIYMMRLITDPLVDIVLDRLMPLVASSLDSKETSFRNALLPEKIQVAAAAWYDHVLQGVSHLLTMVHWDMSKDSTSVLWTNHTEPLQSTDLSNATSVWPLVQEKLQTAGVAVANRWHQFAVGQTGLDRVACVLLGYGVLIFVGSWYLTRGRNVTRRSTADSVQEIIRQQGVFLKVLLFILIELVIFPSVCGVLLDLATLPLFANTSAASRLAFHQANPYSSTFLHWFLGTGFLFNFAVFVTLCREVVRPGVMWFIRDPNDPQFHPVQEMVERPTRTLLQKIGQSALMYSVMIVIGVGGVIFVTHHTTSLFPLYLPLDKPLSTLAIDLLLVQFLLPPLINYLEPRKFAKEALYNWWRLVSRRLRLTSFMFNGRYPEEEGTHIRKSWKAWLFMKQATVVSDVYADVAIPPHNADVIFRRDGQLVRVPKHDGVPVVPGRRMLVPVDPVNFLPIDEQERMAGHPAASDSGDEEQSTTVVYVPPQFQLRVIIFLLLMWLSLSALAFSIMIAPLLLGRHLFETYLGAENQVHDVYAFSLGAYVMVLLSIVVNWFSHLFDTWQAESWDVAYNVMKSSIKEKLYLMVKFIYLGLSAGLVVPLLLGVTVDLYIFMPIRLAKSSEALVLHLPECWSFGVAYLSIIYGVAHVIPNNNLRRTLDQLLENGVMQLNPWGITRTIIVPMVVGSIAAISIPGILAWGVVQMLAKHDPSIQLAIVRCMYPGVFCLIVVILMCILLTKLAKIWMKTVRDDTYLIGKRLHNLEDSTASAAST
ncbi:uncharacterized protein BYT42DRAFT_609419 [Radiomyces spectabilis]|uniref:uncharacterized protein n=1 Tax=Radiomyces spectabilis TaxID=64574 RepID=UPI00221F085C|nr:uncharacterized protein BYT42DRAFT_609419 [Radiomyces spectabilis]KAI8393645.1 hypothetical protein BYT42DRAFT_609419 [Radiomyces spectabilis]